MQAAAQIDVNALLSLLCGKFVIIHAVEGQLSERDVFLRKSLKWLVSLEAIVGEHVGSLKWLNVDEN